MHVHICTYTCIYCISITYKIFLYTYIHVHVHVCAYTHTYIHVHTASVDYVSVNFGTQSSLPYSLNIPTLEDTAMESTETFTLNLSSDNAPTRCSKRTIYILDDDGQLISRSMVVLRI